MRWLAVSVVVLSAFCDVLAEFPPFCDLPMEPGPGQEVIVFLYYNKAEDRCVPFHYGGQGGNENRFITDRMCLRNCSSSAGVLYPPDEREACHLRKQYGHCMSRYLLCEQLCNTTCSGIIDVGEGEEDDSDTPVGLIVGIVLGVTGAIIIIVMIVMVVNTKPNTKEIKKERKDDGSPLKNEGMEMT
ncbi:hypothetical protein SKAU_G00318240 [Synaphobranchus kaupii]|uniref:BPTI/Kunitz inhibitor domain-containing protein n=1 Tax=Synaphobranchus kaupii TaxID=118154 RepID=A0A9Q1ET07_SYNKA|nr:hypothetical protein SKAU_G00318240 [Synaphobranchus kaupii]